MTGDDARRERATKGLRLVLITDRATCRGDLEPAVARALTGGVTAVMLREHDLSHADLVRLGHGILLECRRAGALFIVNRNVEAAAELGADGVHLGFRSAGVVETRAMMGPGALVGRSTHHPDELDRAVADGVDYVTFGPVYDTPSKSGLLEPRGVDVLREAVGRARPVPVVALGGVTAAHAAELRSTGCAGVACIREILARDDVAEAARALRSAWEAA